MNDDLLPKVSVIIPAYNAAEYINDALDSILNQTYQNFEVIVIDDASTDDTYKKVKQYANNKIKIYKNSPNLGVGATRTKGIHLSRGEYICWQDADDISTPERIEKQVAFLDSHPRVGVVGGWIEFFGENTKSVIRRYASDDESLRSSIFRYNPVAQPAAMFRKECFDRVGYYNEAYKVAEDLEMLFRVGVEYEFANVPEVVLRYRQLPSSLTRSSLKKMELQALALRKQYSSNLAYHFSLFDRIYNFLQKASLFMPVEMRMKLFRFIRGDK